MFFEGNLAGLQSPADTLSESREEADVVEEWNGTAGCAWHQQEGINLEKLSENPPPASPLPSLLRHLSLCTTLITATNIKPLDLTLFIDYRHKKLFNDDAQSHSHRRNNASLAQLVAFLVKEACYPEKRRGSSLPPAQQTSLCCFNHRVLHEERTHTYSQLTEFINNVSALNQA